MGLLDKANEIATGYSNLALKKLGLLSPAMMLMGKQRYETCHACADYDEVADKCAFCGCKMSAKILVPFSYCPAGRWLMQPHYADLRERKMKVLTPGYRYVLPNKTNAAIGQVFQFIEAERGEHGRLVIKQDGITNESVISMLIDRIGSLNEKLPDMHNNRALLFLTKALEELEARTKERQERGVEGTTNP